MISIFFVCSDQHESLLNSVFRVAHGDDGRWLRSNRGDPDDVWGPVNRWVFARRKQN